MSKVLVYYIYIYIYITPNVKNISYATASASSTLTSSETTNSLKQTSPAANKAPLLKSKNANKRNDLNGLKNHVLDILESGKHKIQNRALLALQKIMSKAERPIKLKHFKQII